MERKNYYVILGVSETESEKNIRKAFKKLARTFHPDLAGPEETRHFQDILEAYHVLCDQERRRDYNESLRRWKAGPLVSVSVGKEVSSIEPESLLSEPISLVKDFQTIRPSLGELLERIVKNFTGIGVTKGERPEGLTVEIILSVEEAIRGGLVDVDVPVFAPCPFCGGTGQRWLLPCTECEEQGYIESEKTVRIRIPSRVKDGEIFEIPLSHLGIKNLYLRLHIRIDEHYIP